LLFSSIPGDTRVVVVGGVGPLDQAIGGRLRLSFGNASQPDHGCHLPQSGPEERTISRPKSARAFWSLPICLDRFRPRANQARDSVTPAFLGCRGRALTR